MKLPFLIFFSLLSTISCLAQNTSKLLKDTTTLRVYYVLSKKAKGADQVARVDTMLLDIGKSFSRFYDPGRLKRDSAISNIISTTDPSSIKGVNVIKDDETGSMSEMEGTVSSSALEGESYQIIKSRRGEVTVFDYGQHIVTKLQYEDNFPKLIWQLQEGTDSIGGYACQKATLNFRGRNYTAWFTTEIPISEGPWKLSGLPGLILKVEDAEQLFSFIMIGLIQPKQIMPYQVAKSEYLKISREDYRKQVLKRGAGMKVNFTNGIMTIGTVPNKSTPTLMELE
ncbi:MAG: GLPGLI family protein [Pedobacter sp.]